MGNDLSSPLMADVFLALEYELNRNPRVNKKKARKIRNRRRFRHFAPIIISNLSDEEFKKTFRINRENFEILLGLVNPFMHTANAEMARRSSGSSISNRAKLYVTLRYLAGASFHDLTSMYQVSKTAIFSTDPEKGIIWPTIDAILAVPSLQIKLPINDEQYLRATAEGFNHYTNGYMFGCVSAIDGWVCRTRKPSLLEVDNIKQYWNRHNCYATVVIAGCDSRCKFNLLSCMCPGSTNDSLAWSWCPQKKVVEGEEWPKDYYVIGDEGFVCTNNFLIPYSGRGIGHEKDAFNWLLSKMRQCIERAFGLLVQRWGIFWRHLRSEHRHWTKLIAAAATLHNFCIDVGDAPIRTRAERDMEEGDDDLVLTNDDNDGTPPLQHRSRRNSFKLELARAGIRRPSNNMNSRA
jgi:hypothetical protein